MKKLITMLLCVVLALSQLAAQNRTLKGKVTDDKGEPIGNVSVIAKGSSAGTTSAADGTYSLNVPAQTKSIVFSSLNFASQEVSIGNKFVINVSLLTTAESLQEVVVVGYGQQSQKTKIQSISVIKSDVFQNMPIVSATQALQGQAAGVQLTNSSGVLGAQSAIRVRGAASILGSGQPLFVVDGVPMNDNVLSGGQGGGTGLNPLVDLNPNDIESISVLKDASAVAIYGSRGTNGVILVKTKKGKTNQKTKINLDTYAGTSTPTALLQQLSGDQYRGYVSDYRAARNLAPVTLPAGNFDWVNAVVRQGNANSVNLSAIGGTDKTRFYLGGSYFKESGYTIGNDINRLAGRVNIEHDVTKDIKIGTNFNLSNTRSNRTGIENNTFAPLTSSYLQLPYVQPYDANGNFVNTGFIQNVLAIQTININEFTSRRYYGNIYTEIRFLKDFKFKTDWGIDIVQVEERGRTNSLFTPGGRGFRNVLQDQKWLTTNTLTYDKQINNHNVSVLVGQSFETSNNDVITVAGSGFASDRLPNVGSASTPSTTFASREGWALASYFGRVNYRFKDRYLFEVSGRRDGSSRFGTNNKYGNFYAVSGGWIVSDENFFKNIKSIDQLKLTASYGTSGNDRIGNFPYQALYSGGVGGDYNSQAGLIPSQTPNPDLRWEEARQWNIGFSLSVLQSRVNLSLDVFNKRTVNNLVNYPLPYTTGFISQAKNVGEVENKGVDLQLNTINIRNKNFEWNTSFNIGFLKNTVLSLPPNKDAEGRDFLGGSASQRAIVGQSLNTFYLIRYSGINSQTGDAEWLDRNGTITNNPTANDRVVAGNAIPKNTGGFTNNFKYRGFELSVFFNFSYGNSVYIGGLGFTENLTITGFNKTANILNYWKNKGENAFAPRLASTTAQVFSQRSTLQLMDGSYARLKTLSVAYNVPKTILARSNFIQGLRFYVMGQNLWILQNKNFRGPDPEVSANGGDNQIQGESFFAIPQSRTITVGVNVTF